MTRLVQVALVVACALAGGAGVCRAEEDEPPALSGAGVKQKLDSQLPLDRKFTDETGKEVELGRYFDGERPVLLALVYYRCPMLCGLVLNGMTETMREMEWIPGQEFRVVIATIDPRESYELAREKKDSYIESYGRPEAADGWHFLTGDAESIEALAEAVGFYYNYLPEKDEYAHPAAQFVITPDGRVSRYLFGIRHDPQTVRLSLVEASEGKIGSVVDQFLLYCYRYDVEAGKYTPVAWKVMRLGAGLVVIVLGTLMGVLWWREARQRRREKRFA